MKKWRCLWLALLTALVILAGCSGSEIDRAYHAASDIISAASAAPETGDAAPEEGGSYTSREEVAAYLRAYGGLPPNFITKKEAEALGWDSAAGNLWDVAEGKSIGGDRFGNREGLLPDAQGRKWYECDVNYAGGFRGAERLVYSSDGLIYYTGDHYQTFEPVG